MPYQEVKDYKIIERTIDKFGNEVLLILAEKHVDCRELAESLRDKDYNYIKYLAPPGFKCFAIHYQPNKEKEIETPLKEYPSGENTLRWYITCTQSEF